jgi:hypothetical protein
MDGSVEFDNSILDIDETFAEALDFRKSIEATSWKTPGEHYQNMPKLTRQLVNRVVESDERMRDELRKVYFPILTSEGILQLRRSDPRYVEVLQRKRLYTGRVFAADGTLARYETLSLVGAQIAISRVGYQGSTGQFVSNIMHWGGELPRIMMPNEFVESMRRRGKQLKNRLNNLFLQTLMAYKEREILLEMGPDIFKLIQGPIFPYEMLSGAGKSNTLKTCLDLLGRLIDDGAYATIVSSSTDRDLMLFGMSLKAGEYAIVGDGTARLDLYERNAHYSNQPVDTYDGKSEIKMFTEFKNTYGPKVVEGILRAHPMSRPYVFYCNADRVEEAVHMLLADAANTGARGFPLLIDLADRYCAGSFKSGEYTSYMNAEFTRASGGSAMYQSEHSTRD